MGNNTGDRHTDSGDNRFWFRLKKLTIGNIEFIQILAKLLDSQSDESNILQQD